MAKAKAEGSSSDGTFIKYKALPGIVSERTISREDWDSIGIDHDTVTFNRGNRFQVDGSDFPEEVLDYFKGDADFTVSSKDSPPALADKGSLDDLGEGPAGGSGLTGGGTTATSAGGPGSTGAV